MSDFTFVFAIIIAIFCTTIFGKILSSLRFPHQIGDRIGHIDNLRGYLGLSVLFHHFIIWSNVKSGGAWEAPKIAFFNQLGKGSVAIFFMITGFLFYPVILSGFNNVSWKKFYTKRLFRIVPLLLFSIFSISFIIYFLQGNTPNWRYPIEVASWVSGRMSFNLLGFEESRFINAGVLWSIWYEWVFYIFVIPLMSVIRLFFRKKTIYLPLISFVLSLIFRFSGIEIFQYLPLFFIGMISYELKEMESVYTFMKSKTSSTISIILMILSMTIFHDPYGIAMPMIGFFFLSVSCGNSLFGLMNSRGSLVLGECSYGIYLIHGIILYLFFTEFYFQISPLLALPALSVIVTAATATTYLMIEAPGIKAGSRLSKTMLRKLPDAV